MVFVSISVQRPPVVTAYLQASFAKNQDVIVVSINYRTGIFGFPFSPDPKEIAVHHHNLGLEDQDLALLWTQLNIEAFGGDRQRVTIMGQSAGASSVTWLLNRHSIAPPFQSAIMFSSAFLQEATPILNGTVWDTFAAAVGCTGPSGFQRIDCLKKVPANTINDFVNAVNDFADTDGVTAFNAFIDKYEQLLFLRKTYEASPRTAQRCSSIRWNAFSSSKLLVYRSFKVACKMMEACSAFPSLAPRSF